MKKTILGIFSVVGVLFINTSAFAHGAIAHQAAEAVESATKLFLSAQPKEVTRQFQSVTAENTGVERFKVTITLKDLKTVFDYNCSENETVTPEVWECE